MVDTFNSDTSELSDCENEDLQTQRTMKNLLQDEHESVTELELFQNARYKGSTKN